MDSDRHTDDTQPLALPFRPVEPEPAAAEHAGREDALVARAGTEVASTEVHEGEVMTAQESAELDRRRQGPTRLLPPPVARQRVAVPARAGVRHLYYVGAGGLVAARRWRDAHSGARYERQMRAAETDADQERLKDWEARAAQAKALREQRRQARAEAPLRWLKALAGGFAVALLALTLLGVLLAASFWDISLFTGPFTTLAAVVRALVTVIGVAWGPAVVLGLLAGLGWLWWQGRAHVGSAPQWMASPAQQAETAQSFAILNEDMIVRALAHCKVTDLSKALRAGEKVSFDVLPRQQGGGTYLQARFPMGVKAADFLHPGTIERLAANLRRHQHEVYPQRQPDADAAVLDLWVADPGTMDRPAPPWPLLSEGEFDVFRDRVPWGVTMRGEQVEQAMLNRHGLLGATSKQGKTATLRIPALALALDPTVEHRIADLKGDGDWSMFAPRAHTLIEGGAQEDAAATCAMLEALVAEMQDRYERKRAAGIRGAIPRELSRQPGSGFHPIYAWVDECQVLYQADHPIGGTKDDSRAWKAARRLHDQARAVNIHLFQATQRPDNTAIPVAVREGAHVRISLKVPDYRAAKMVVAEAADLGARPQDLRMGRDAGTFVATGEFDDIPEGMAFLIVKSYYVSTADAYPVIERAMQILHNHGRTIDPAALTPAQPEQQADPLTDIAAALGDQPRERTFDVLAALKDRHPAAYGDWSLTDLAAALPEVAKPYKTRHDGATGVMVIAADRIHQAITDRDQPAGDGAAPDPATETASGEGGTEGGPRI